MPKAFNLILLILLCFIILLYHGCRVETGSDNTSPSTPSSTANEPIYWTEQEGRFYTNDLPRAQAETPFPIVLPTYIPDKRQDTPPGIDGSLRPYGKDGEIEVRIRYAIYISREVTGYMIITESNYPYFREDPETNPELERIEIEGISVVKTKDDWSPGSDAYYGFNSNNIFYFVETHNLSNKESNKIVESMLAQIK